MFRRKRGPNKSFVHAEGCRIVQTDPSVEIPWNCDGDGLWKAECVCTTEYFREPITDNRVRLDPLDPMTSPHAPECEYVDERDRSVLKVLLRVKPGLGPGYSWVECGACAAGWQVALFAESVG